MDYLYVKTKRNNDTYKSLTVISKRIELTKQEILALKPENS